MKVSANNIFRIIIWIIMLFGGAIISIYFDKRYFYTWFNSIIFHIVSMILGYILLKIVLKISRNTGKYLSTHGREGDIPRLQTNRLVTTGIYACMRHPMHFGLMFFPLAFALLLGSPTFILILVPLEIILILLLIKFIEEPQAEKKFGNTYREYKKKVPFMNFSLQCIEDLLKDE